MAKRADSIYVGGAQPLLAQGAGRANRRSCDSRLHRARLRADGVRGASPGLLGEWHVQLRPGVSGRGSPPDCSKSSGTGCEASRPPGPRGGAEAAGGGAHRWVTPETGRGGALPGGHRGGRPAPSLLRAASRGQAPRRLPPGRRRPDGRPSRPTPVRGRTGRPGRPLHQPGQALLAGGRVRQGRPGRLLPGRRPLDPALPRRPAGRADALPRRHPRQVLLPEERPRVRAVVDPAGSGSTARDRSAIWTTSSSTTRSRSSTSTNSAGIPLHIWLSRTADISRPDFCVLDLDPKTRPSPTWCGSRSS